MFKFTKKTRSVDTNDEHRETEDRRYFKPAHEFPILDEGGQLINKDRRKQPERRLSNIEVEFDILGQTSSD